MAMLMRMPLFERPSFSATVAVPLLAAVMVGWRQRIFSPL